MKYLKLYWLYVLSFLTFLVLIIVSVKGTINDYEWQLSRLKKSYSEHCTVITEEKNNGL